MWYFCSNLVAFETFETKSNKRNNNNNNNQNQNQNQNIIKKIIKKSLHFYFINNICILE